MSDILKNAWNQNSVLTLITGFSYIANIVSVAIKILDPANDPKHKKKRSTISIILFFVAIIFTVVLLGVTALPELNTASTDGDEPYYYEDVYGVDEFGYLHYNGHKYLVESHTDIDSFWEAENYCEQFGAHLAIINDDTENAVLYKYVFETMGYNNAYFGLTNEGHEGYWEWVDGTSLTYDNWMEGQPDDRPGEYYALFWHDDITATWNTGDFGKDEATGVIIILMEWD